ncbi:protocatechuate 3,4-dioxygenase subunit alpha [Bartonella apis]|uniref:protocatechuate 3,4-dioxygenase subunit alpha n=1 Tax=Bartonella apis TaxID=1686310 RepID=UPI0026F11B52|nr:protocatechuate 3,4-dioxygenase subunit alpha [Bartonella apis]
MVQELHYLKESPSQTVGPYIHIGATPNYVGIHGVYPHDLGSTMLTDETKGERIILEGQVFDGGGEPIKDALVEIWQADANGLYNSVNETRGRADPTFTGWGRQPASADKAFFRFETIRPGVTPYPDGRKQAPHITVWVGARGINIGLHTRAYFSDMEELNKKDPLLNRIDSEKRRNTLIAKKSERDNVTVFTFNIIVQGENETVFLDI